MTRATGAHHDDGAPLTRDEFLGRLRDEGQSRYHDRHPFHLDMHEGRLSRAELKLWAENRYYYQTRIPIKDALVLAKAEDPDFRRVWLRRIVDHDGELPESGGLALFRRLARALGARDEELASHRNVLPGVRFACDAYVTLVEKASLVEAVAASLTETLAPELMQRRVAALEKHYPFIPRDALEYFRIRVDKARGDGQFALGLVLEHARTRREQEACVRALVTKTEVLWQLLDGVQTAARARSTS